MAIIYTYANFSPLTGNEKVLISDSETNQATRTATAQQIANLAGGSTGVNRVFFNDNVGLTPSYTQTVGNETVGRGVVEFSGTLLPGAGGTGKDSAALTGATAGQVLVLNPAKDGWDFGNATGEIYTLSTTVSSGSCPINLTDSAAIPVTTTVTLTAGTGIAVSSAGTSEIVITNDSPAIAYTTGNGIDLSLFNASNIIAADLKSGGGLSFDGAEITTSLSATNIGGAPGTAGQCLVTDGLTPGTASWAERIQQYQWVWTPCLVSDANNPATTDLQSQGLITYDVTPGSGSSIQGQQGSITRIGNLLYYDFYLKFTIDNGTYPAPQFLSIAADRNDSPGGPGLGDPGGLPVIFEEQQAVTATLPESQLNNGSVTISLAVTSGSSATSTSMWPFVPQGGKVSQTSAGIVDLYSLVYNGAAPAVGNGLQTSFNNDWFSAVNETEVVELAGTITVSATQAIPE